MTLIFSVGGSLKLTDEAGTSYTCKLREIAIDGGQPIEIDTTTTADSIRQTYVSTPEPDRLTADVLLEDVASGQVGYETFRAYMTSGEDLDVHLILKNDAATPADHIVYNESTIVGHLVDVQQTAPREEAAALSLVLKIKR
mgnify:CR=1 FL=1|tara:strand:+ start:2455 stop:2877 length:423 start_codon:yes stop_codon:yes gene_type:complete